LARDPNRVAPESTHSVRERTAEAPRQDCSRPERRIEVQPAGFVQPFD